MPKATNYARITSRVEQSSTGHTRREMLAALGGGVYAVRVQGDLIKIGYTKNLRNRVQSLGVGTHALIGLLPHACLEDERAIHAKLAGHAVKGREWYAASDSAVILVVNEMRTTMGLSPL